MRIVSVFFIAFILGLCANTHAQNPYIRHFSPFDGLPSNTIYQIYQDRQQFIWFTSDAGVVKFDGSTFKSFRKKDGLSSNDVVRIKEDTTGRIWLFNYNGSVNFIYNNKVYNGKNAPFLNSLAGNGFIVDFYTDADKTMHFYTWQGEIFSLDTNYKVLKDNINKPIAQKLPFNSLNFTSLKVLFFSQRPSDDWIIWCNMGIFKRQTLRNSEIAVVNSDLHCRTLFPINHNTFYGITYSDELIRINDIFQTQKIPYPGDIIKIKNIIEDSQGYLWIAAYDEGVYCLKNNKVIRHFNIKDALGLLQDHERNIWVSSRSEGVYVINHDILEQKHFDRTYFDNHGVNLLRDFPGTGIWCSNNQAAFYLKNDVFHRLAVPKVLQPVDIVFMFKDHTLLLGSTNGQLGIFENIKFNTASKEMGYRRSSIYQRYTKKIINDRSGNVAVTFDQNRIQYISQDKPSLDASFKMISERINNAHFNADNELVINGKKNYLFKNSRLVYYPELSRFDGTIISDHLIMDESAELFNIDGDSLYIMKNGRFYNLTSAFDIPINSQINKIVYVDSTLYLATLKDIFVCHNPMKLISGVPVNIDPLNISFNNINDLLVHNDTLLVASDDGLTMIAEASIAKSIALPPVPYLQSIIVNDKVFSLAANELKLTGKNNINLSFGCISYSFGPKIYSYMLEGYENKWTSGTGSLINLVYQNLPRGHYVFKYRVRKSNSAWSKPLELAVIIKPTLVEYPVFWALAALLVSGFLFVLIYSIRVQRMKKQEVDLQLVVLEQKALQSMMNPHFIFNSLGSIQNYLLSNKGSEAILYLSQFAALIRQNLTAINTQMILLEDETERLRNYIGLESKRLENKFEYFIEIDKQLEEEDIYIPSMIIQPIVENSIWHGIATLEEKGTIKISVRAHTSRSLKINIQDNGIGLKKAQEYSAKSSQQQHLGMQIIKKRLYLLGKKFNTETSINYAEQSPGNVNPGALVEIILPFVYNKDDI